MGKNVSIYCFDTFDIPSFVPKESLNTFTDASTILLNTSDTFENSSFAVFISKDFIASCAAPKTFLS